MPKKSLVSWNKNLNTCQTHLNNVSTNRLFLRVCLWNARGGAGLWVVSTKCKPWDRQEPGQTQDTGWVGPGIVYTAQVNGIQKVVLCHINTTQHEHDFCLVYFFEVIKLRLHVELIPISEHQHDFKFSWSWSTVIYLLSTYKMVGIFQMFRKLSIDGIKDCQRKLLY